jgi:hypothetical protein
MNALPSTAEPHDEHVAEPRQVPEPRGLGERPEQGHPHRHAGAHERRVLERMQRLARQRPLVQGGNVPDVEVGEPQRQRDQWVEQVAQPPQPAQREQRLEQRAGEAEHDQERRQVAEHEVLRHVRDQQLLAHVRKRGDERRQDQRDARGKAQLAPHRYRLAAHRQGPRAQRVRDRHHREWQQLERLEGARSDVRDRHRSQRTAGVLPAYSHRMRLKNPCRTSTAAAITARASG